MDSPSTFRFRAEGMAMDSAGYIVGRRGPYTMIEGVGPDHGFYFVKGPKKTRRYDSLGAADAAIDKKIEKRKAKGKEVD